jgi:hypothetical protein
MLMTTPAHSMMRGHSSKPGVIAQLRTVGLPLTCSMPTGWFGGCAVGALMAKRAKPAWGSLGVVCIRGFGQTDDEFVARGIGPGEQGRGNRGCVFSDDQFACLATHLKLTDSTLVAEVRARLDSVRKFYLTSRLYEAASPMQAERNAALAVMCVS